MASAKTLLDIGQCDADHSRIRDLLSQVAPARILRAHRLEDAAEIVRKEKIDLILVNRLLDRDGSQGLDVIRSFKQDPQTRDIPVMLVSNYADAQQAAIAEGAIEGFGKNQLKDRVTTDRLRTVLQST